METKKQFRIFTILEHEKEQEYLRKMHKSGWKFVKVNKLCVYTFEKCEPEDVVYQLDYISDSTTDRSEYLQMFKDCGWEYLQDYMGYIYFRKPVKEMSQGDEEIFCDDASRVQMFERVFKGRIIPLLVIFSLLIIPNLLRFIFIADYEFAALFAVFAVIYISTFTAFTVKYIKYKNKTK